MNRVTFFTKPDCTLCDAAKFVILKVQQQVPFEFSTIDISAPENENWNALYCDHIPVVHINGREFSRHRVDERSFRAALDSK